MTHPLRFLDVNCAVGPYWNPPPGHDWSLAGLVREMDEWGIAEACPASLLGRDYHPLDGNTWLAQHAPASERIHPVWTAATHHTGEFPHPDDLLQAMQAQSVRLLRLFLAPASFLDRLDLPLLGELLDALAEHRVPLLVEYLDPLQLHATELEPVLRGWPALPVILSVTKSYKSDRWWFYLWERYDHLYVELSGLQKLGMIEQVVARFGPRRLVYGSRYPYFTPLQTMLQVVYSEVDEAAKRAIAGDTVRGLLQEVWR